jgi:hypothetical protein
LNLNGDGTEKNGETATGLNSKMVIKLKRRPNIVGES